MHAYWQTNNTVHSSYASYSRGHQDSQSRGSVACWKTQTLVLKHPDDSNSSPEVWSCSLFIVPPTVAQEFLVMSYNDIMIVCSNLKAGKPLFMHSRATTVHLCIYWHPCWKSPILWRFQTSSSLFLIPFPCLWHICRFNMILYRKRLQIYMSQAQKRDYERDKEVWSSCSNWGSGVDAGGCTDEHWQFWCTCTVVFLPEDQSRWSWHHYMMSWGSLMLLREGTIKGEHDQALGLS